jgi:hypothetical protein
MSPRGDIWACVATVATSFFDLLRVAGGQRSRDGGRGEPGPLVSFDGEEGRRLFMKQMGALPSNPSFPPAVKLRNA